MKDYYTVLIGRPCSEPVITTQDPAEALDAVLALVTVAPQVPVCVYSGNADVPRVLEVINGQWRCPGTHVEAA